MLTTLTALVPIDQLQSTVNSLVVGNANVDIDHVIGTATPEIREFE